VTHHPHPMIRQAVEDLRGAVQRLEEATSVELADLQNRQAEAQLENVVRLLRTVGVGRKPRGANVSK
jgi:hypothetical protein